MVERPPLGQRKWSELVSYSWWNGRARDPAQSLLGLQREPWAEDWAAGVSLPPFRPLPWEGGLAEAGRVLWGSPGDLGNWVFGLLDPVLTGVVARHWGDNRVWKSPPPGKIQLLRSGLNPPPNPSLS